MIWRSLPRGIVGTVRTCRVVRDNEIIAVTILPGFPYLQRTGRRGGPGGRVLLEWDGGHRRRIWTENRVLSVHRPDDAFSVELFWRDSDDEFLGWHVNIQRPWHRTALGFDSRDLILDVVVRPDRSTQWKDEDELAFALERGSISRAEAEIARAAGEIALTRAARHEPPFDDSLLAWRPDPSLTPPELPEEWRQVRSESFE